MPHIGIGCSKIGFRLQAAGEKVGKGSNEGRSGTFLALSSVLYHFLLSMH